MITLNITIGGNLLIELQKGAKEELKELIEKEGDERNILATLLEDSGYIGNDWHTVEGVLTEAPIIGFGCIFEDDEADFPTDYEKVWSYNDYMVKNFAEELLTNKKVIFKKA
jgi:hypothetical protein